MENIFLSNDILIKDKKKMPNREAVYFISGKRIDNTQQMPN
jgi:hypothetical protein